MRRNHSDRYRRMLAHASTIPVLCVLACTPQRDTPTTAPTIAGSNTGLPRWRITKEGETCFAQRDLSCAPDDPMCKPAAKVPYACPTYHGGAVDLLKGVRIEGNEGACSLLLPADGCPPGAACDPPPPLDVACPDG